jgi:hypothetical protein
MMIIMKSTISLILKNNKSALLNKKRQTHWNVDHHVKYEMLKALVITTYNDPEAAAKERKLLVDLKMLEGRGPNEFYSRLISQFEVCENTTRCDVSMQTVADTFVLGLISSAVPRWARHDEQRSLCCR